MLLPDERAKNGGDRGREWKIRRVQWRKSRINCERAGNDFRKPAANEGWKTENAGEGEKEKCRSAAFYLDQETRAEERRDREQESGARPEMRKFRRTSAGVEGSRERERRERAAAGGSEKARDATEK